jgi:hypothetical protein
VFLQPAQEAEEVKVTVVAGEGGARIRDGIETDNAAFEGICGVFVGASVGSTLPRCLELGECRVEKTRLNIFGIVGSRFLVHGLSCGL